MSSARSFDDAWSDLTTIIELGRRLRFVLVECEDEGVRAALQQKLLAHCEAEERPFEAPAGGGDVLGWLIEQQARSAEIPAPERDRVQPVRFFPVPSGQDETFALYRLNENRDNLRRDLRGVLVLCGLHDFLRRAVQDAPDLWSMREKTFELTARDLPPLAGARPKPEEQVPDRGAPPVPAVPRPRYDAFLSYAYADREAAADLLSRLKPYGIRVFMADPSGSLDKHALAEGEYFVPLLSPAWVHSRWPDVEVALKSMAEEELARRTVPIMVRPSVLPGYLSRFSPLSWRTVKERERSFANLLRVLQGSGRELPATAPTPAELKQFGE